MKGDYIQQIGRNAYWLVSKARFGSAWFCNPASVNRVYDAILEELQTNLRAL